METPQIISIRMENQEHVKLGGSGYNPAEVA